MGHMVSKFLSWLQWLDYRYTSWKFGVAEDYVRSAFNGLVELDVDEYKTVPIHGFEFTAVGNQVHIRDKRLGYECLIKETVNKDIVVDEWQEETREVQLELGAIHKTNWHEVFRSGKLIRNAVFMQYLKILYGERKHVQDTKAKSVGVCAQAEAGTEIHTDPKGALSTAV